MTNFLINPEIEIQKSNNKSKNKVTKNTQKG